MPKSSRTFEDEFNALRDIPNIFWGNDYPLNPFEGIEEHAEGTQRAVNPENDLSGQAEDDTSLPSQGQFFPLNPQRTLYGLDREADVRRIGETAGKSDIEFAEAFWDNLGFDIEEMLADRIDGRFNVQSLRDLTATFGTDAFGAYCPWHAFERWGIYLFLEKLVEWAQLLHRSDDYLPHPKPPLLSVFRLLWWLTWRHELFHYHVEVFAIRLEVSLRQPKYRPYVDRVRAEVAKTEVWWEEALAQAVVRKSTMVKRALKIDKKYLDRYVVPYFRCFPEGYKRFECLSVGGPKRAHQILSAQIARTEIEPCYPNTNLALAKDEYRISPKTVPGFIVMTPSFRHQFQVATPELRDVVRFVKQNGTIDEKAPGDHKRAVINGQIIHINRAKRDNTIDLASAKALARALGIRVSDLRRTIAA